MEQQPASAKSLKKIERPHHLHTKSTADDRKSKIGPSVNSQDS
jgi:hypothetical protein